MLFILFVIQIIILFFLSRVSIRYIFYILHAVTSNNTVIYSIIAFIFFPGTVLHELSHFMMAIVLLLKVREIHIFPSWEKGYIKLGRVIYEKKDVFRSILVGIAPIIVGLLFFWWLSAVGIFETNRLGLKILLGYIIFIISSTMFSSKQDLVDVVYIIPILLLFGVMYYFFPINISSFKSFEVIVQGINRFLNDVNIYLFMSIAIHVVLVSVIFILLRILKK